MRTLIRFFLLCSLLGTIKFPALATPVPVTVLIRFEHPHSRVFIPNLQHQLLSILTGTGVAPEVRDQDEVLPNAQFGQLLLFKMKGNCSMEPLPIAALSDERGPLAMAYTTDGKVLPFGEVECDQVRSCLQRMLGRQSTKAYQPVFDAALGIVIAHEIYHMLAHTSGHTQAGFTKGELTARELLDNKLSLPEIARLAIRQNTSDLP